MSDLNKEFEIAFSAAVRASQMTPTSSRSRVTQKNVTTDMPEENILDDEAEEEGFLDRLLETDDRENISDEDVEDEASSGGKSTPSDSELEEEEKL